MQDATGQHQMCREIMGFSIENQCVFCQQTTICYDCHNCRSYFCKTCVPNFWEIIDWKTIPICKKYLLLDRNFCEHIQYHPRKIQGENIVISKCFWCCQEIYNRELFKGSTKQTSFEVMVQESQCDEIRQHWLRSHIEDKDIGKPPEIVSESEMIHHNLEYAPYRWCQISYDNFDKL